MPAVSVTQNPIPGRLLPCASERPLPFRVVLSAFGLSIPGPAGV